MYETIDLILKKKISLNDRKQHYSRREWQALFLDSIPYVCTYINYYDTMPIEP